MTWWKNQCDKNPLPRLSKQTKCIFIMPHKQTSNRRHLFSLSATAREFIFLMNVNLANQIREELGFDSVPLKLIFRKKR